VCGDRSPFASLGKKVLEVERGFRFPSRFFHSR